MTMNKIQAVYTAVNIRLIIAVVKTKQNKSQNRIEVVKC